MTCPDCHCEDVEHDAASGNAFCARCGVILSENQITSEVTFGENATGAAIVQGSYVGLDQTRARTFTAGRRAPGGTGMESREQTILNARRRIFQIGFDVKMADSHCEQALRYYTLALANEMCRGRKLDYIVAGCLYLVARLQKLPLMLIDFSDSLRINVFVLGSTYMKLIQKLQVNKDRNNDNNWKAQIPLVDPAIHLLRFAAMLDFGDETQQVARDAARLVARFKQDWMIEGRRPGGVCGASLFLAARMNNFRRSIEEIVQVVKVADITLKKRLEEFAETPSASLTVNDFRSIWLSEISQPPSWQHNRKLEAGTAGVKKAKKPRKVRFNMADDDAEEDEEEEENEEEEARESDGQRPSKKRKRPSRHTDENGDIDVPYSSDPAADDVPDDESMATIQSELAEMAGAEDDADRGVLDDDAAEEEEEGLRMHLPGQGMSEAQEEAFLDRLGLSGALDKGKALSKQRQKEGLLGKGKTLPPDTRTAEEIARDEQEDADIAQEITGELGTEEYTALSAELAERERINYMRANDKLRYGSMPAGEDGKPAPSDALDDLNEEELDYFILSPEEVRIKERIWMDMNRDFLEWQAQRFVDAEKNGQTLKKRERKKKVKPRDSSNPLGATAAEAAKTLLKQKKFSKKINYSAIDAMFEDGDGDENGTKGPNLFEEDDGNQDAWETASRASGVSRASSLAPSSSGTAAKKRVTKRKKKSDTEDQAEKLHNKLVPKSKAALTPKKTGAQSKGKNAANAAPAGSAKPAAPTADAAAAAAGGAAGEEDAGLADETMADDDFDEEPAPAPAGPADEDPEMAEFRRLQFAGDGDEDGFGAGGGDDDDW